MARSEKRRQQKLARQKKKRRSKHSGTIKASAGLGLLREQARIASTLPLLHCSMPDQDGDSEAGVGTVVIARGSFDGEVFAAFFLVDFYCLGVKDAALLHMPGDRFYDRILMLNENEPQKTCSPACAKKFVLDSVDYARNLGFSPHPDYKEAALLLPFIDASECTETFEFGRDGMPLYCSGPYDSPATIKRALATLEKSCGSGNYRYIAALSSDF